MNQALFLNTKSLTKDYGSHKGAFDISVSVNSGQIVGFLGPNGAGKTTTLRMIMGFTFPNSGKVELLGKEILSEQDRVELLPRIGFLPSDAIYPAGLRVNQLLELSADILQQNLSNTITELAAQLDLDLSAKIEDLSTGNKRKVGIVNAVMHSPDLIILDEPTSGLDPLIQHKVLRLLQAHADRGAAIFLSSHVLTEVEQICDRIFMIKDGNIILEDSTKNILDKALRRIRVKNIDQSLKSDLKGLNGIERYETINDEQIIYTSDPKAATKFLTQNNIYDFYSEKPSLEEMFIDQYK